MIEAQVKPIHLQPTRCHATTNPTAFVEELGFDTCFDEPPCDAQTGKTCTADRDARGLS